MTFDHAPEAKDRIIIALDFPHVDAAQALVTTLGDTASFYKIGFEMVLSGGLDFAATLIGEGKNVFLDMKLLDIPNTIEKAAAAAARLGVKFLTVHGYPFALEAARRGVDSVPGAKTEILSVTVMTSVSQSDLTQSGYSRSIEELIEMRARQAVDLGIDGLILSAKDVSFVRDVIGNALTLVTPGIRPKGADAGDQSRVMDPETAMSIGCDYLVIGRPITKNDDPAQAMQDITAMVQAGLSAQNQ